MNSLHRFFGTYGQFSRVGYGLGCYDKFLETVADWYRYADNLKKIVGFCAYVIRSSLAKLYAARYMLKSRAKVYKIASRDLSRPLRESSNNPAPEYSDLLRMGLVDAIEDHEKLLREYITLQDPKFFCDLHRTIKREGLSLPQDEISEIVWDYKTLGIRRYRSLSTNESNATTAGDLDLLSLGESKFYKHHWRVKIMRNPPNMPAKVPINCEASPQIQLCLHQRSTFVEWWEALRSPAIEIVSESLHIRKIRLCNFMV
ncbi:hypothetical protein F3Y22_tig00111303pilonHSYRG00093 [Hibiscus syriacus]|uniref:Domain X domain-containing protein n=1 Tax=Hibiscus syriacus TaxID=106335 RepID=A0A6A2YR54_HIBSY|nr:hypothetical protein F3Y22_tig00111303pilonHSYRG00093 [Hibiscus syriacus]